MSAEPISAQRARWIYDLLVDEAGANRAEADSFVHHLTTAHPMQFEYRIRGHLGFGGKFRVGQSRIGKRRLYVDCYPEDLTPERQKIMDAVNSKLACYC